MLRRAPVLCLALLACSADDPRAVDDMTPDEEVGFEERCAEESEALGVPRPEGWAAASHCKSAPPDPDTVFPEGRVTSLVIRISAEEYAAMQADLAELTSGSGDFERPFLEACEDLGEGEVCEVAFDGAVEPGTCQVWNADGALGCVPDSWALPDEWVTACEGRAPGDACATREHAGVCEDDGGGTLVCWPGAPTPSTDPCLDRRDGDACQQGEMPGTCVTAGGPRICQADGFDPADLSAVPDEAAAGFWPREPRYVHADVVLDGVVFTSVGLRYKGNFGLAVSQGEKKPLRIKLDEWEDELPAVTDQRMFGFQNLSLSPGNTDPSALHQVLAADTFRRSGVPAPLAAFVEVSLDTGDGSRLLGLYAITEMPGATMLEREFGDDDGNLYKPDGRGAHFVDFVPASMHQSRGEVTDLADVERFVGALHASQADRDGWRAALQATFDMEAFTDFFAVNQAIGNWDTYGGYAHNFYLYGDPAGGALRFIPWDFDLSFDGTGSAGADDFTLWRFGGEWPLLQAIARDVAYATRLRDRLEAFAADELTSGALAARVDALADLVRPAIAREAEVAPGRDAMFEDGLVALRDHIAGHGAALTGYLDGSIAGPPPALRLARPAAVRPAAHWARQRAYRAARP